MIEASPLDQPTGTLLRHALAAFGEPVPADLPDATPGWHEDARFFATAYLAGLIFFLLILA